MSDVYDEIREKIKEGVPIERIAKEYKRSRMAIHKIGIRANLIDGRPLLTKNQVLSKLRDAEVDTSVLTVKECAELTGVSEYYLRKYVGKENFQCKRINFTTAEIDVIKKGTGKDIKWVAAEIYNASGNKRSNALIKNKAKSIGVSFKGH